MIYLIFNVLVFTQISNPSLWKLANIWTVVSVIIVVTLSSPSVSISPVSRDEHVSVHEFSPVTDGTDGCPLEQLMDMEAQGRAQRHTADTSPYPKLQAGSGVGDLNKNLLIQAYNAASESSQLIHSVGPSKLDVQ